MRPLVPWCLLQWNSWIPFRQIFLKFYTGGRGLIVKSCHSNLILVKIWQQQQTLHKYWCTFMIFCWIIGFKNFCESAENQNIPCIKVFKNNLQFSENYKNCGRAREVKDTVEGINIIWQHIDWICVMDIWGKYTNSVWFAVKYMEIERLHWINP